MATITLRPSGDGTTTGWTHNGGGTFAADIVDDPDSNDGDTSYVASPDGASGTMWVSVRNNGNSDVPADFDPTAINSISIKIATRRLNTPQMAVDDGDIQGILQRSDESTAISTTPAAQSSPISGSYSTLTFSPTATGTHSVADWNAARLALVFTHSNNQTPDDVNQARITATEIIVDYTPTSSDVNVNATTDALTLTEQGADVNLDRSVAATTDTLTLTSQSADVNLNRVVAASTASLTLTPQASTVNAATNVQASTASLTVATFAATVTVSGDVNVAAGVDALTLTALGATVNAATNVQAGVRALTLAPQAAVVNASTNVAGGLASLTLTENAASVSLGRSVQAGVVTLTLNTNAATVNAERNVLAQVDTLNITAFGALVGGNVNVSALVVALSVNPFGASISTQGDGGYDEVEDYIKKPLKPLKAHKTVVYKPLVSSSFVRPYRS